MLKHCSCFPETGRVPSLSENESDYRVLTPSSLRYIFEAMCPGYDLSFTAAPDGVTPEQLDQLSKLESRKMVLLRPKMMAYGSD